MNKLLNDIFQNQTLTGLTLSKCVDPTILRTTGRLVKLKDQVFLALETFLSDGKAIHKNIPVADAAVALLTLVPDQYKQLNLRTTGGDCEIKVSKKGKITMLNRIRQDGVQTADLSHNREKYIRAAIESAFAQDYEGEMEYIFSDDCSTDRTFEIIQECVAA